MLFNFPTRIERYKSMKDNVTHLKKLPVALNWTTCEIWNIII
jgi:hypothetical protein